MSSDLHRRLFLATLGDLSLTSATTTPLLSLPTDRRLAELSAEAFNADDFGAMTGDPDADADAEDVDKDRLSFALTRS